MRLLRLDSSGEISLTKNLEGDIPKYGILSHTWGNDEDEVTFDDLCNGTGKSKIGYAKLHFCSQKANQDGLEYFWVDTCCIKKTDSAELSEALNSMFGWYQRAEKCYVYLSDVSSRKRDFEGESHATWEAAFRKSRWFTRGWTLQELLAPMSVDFFSREGSYLSSKQMLTELTQEITGVPAAALLGKPLSTFSVEERMRWVETRETRKEDKVYCLLGLFDVFMAPLYGEGERNALTRLKDLIAKSYRNQLDGIGHTFTPTHTFPSDTSSVEPAPSATEEVSSISRRKELMASLGFDHMDSRQATIKRAYSTTCEWILTNPSYMDWCDPKKLHQHHGFLWINGKPGAGKSTLVKFARTHAEKQGSETELLLSFFFNARGDKLEKSTIGMYRSLLYQLLEKAADLQIILDRYESLLQQNQPPTWTIDLLRECFEAALAKIGSRQLKCFIDALDECDEQEIQDMIWFFEELGQNALKDNTPFYVCFASRHYPTIDIRNGLHLTLENEDGHGEDMKKYLKHHLRAGKGKYVDEVRTLIQEKANGVFMWAVLVVDILNKEFRRGRIFAVKKRLEEIPPELSDLFKDILRRDSTDLDDLLLCLQWILFAKRPLRREEFYFAMVAGIDPRPENLVAWDPESITLEDMNRFVLNSSKGLAEITKAKVPTVQFIHESVRDFLIKDGGIHELWPELGREVYELSHDKLKDCCQSYLNSDMFDDVLSITPDKASSDEAKEFRKSLTIQFPLADYASRYILEHADEAARHVSQYEFIQGFSLKRWISITNLLEQFQVRRHTQTASLLYILAEKNVARLITTVGPHSGKMDVRGERYQFPLFAALANGHREATRALLPQGEGHPIEDITTDLEFGRDFSVSKDQTPLTWAIERRHWEVAIVLLNSMARDSVLSEQEGSQAITNAARLGLERVVKFLLEKKLVNSEQSDENGATPLTQAVLSRQTCIVQTLLEYGVSVSAQDANGRDALCSAAYQGSEEIVQLLLNYGADPETSNELKQTPLLLAASSGHSRLVRLLLGLGVSTDTKDIYHKTALILAASNGHEVAVQSLLEHGANIAESDAAGDTALTEAVVEGHEKVVSILLNEGADIEQRDPIGAPLLFRAISRGHDKIIQVLLDYGANIEATDHSGRTPIFWVIEQETSVLEALINRGANIEAKDSHGRTVLSYVCQRGDLNAFQILLAHNVGVMAKDKYGRTMLHWTIECSLLSITPLPTPVRLTLLEKQNKKRLLMERQQQDQIASKPTEEQTERQKSFILRQIPLALRGQPSWLPKRSLGEQSKAIISLLLAHGIEINATDIDGQTALVRAAELGFDDAVEELLDWGANTEIRDNSGQDALSYSRSGDNKRICELLTRHTL